MVKTATVPQEDPNHPTTPRAPKAPKAKNRCLCGCGEETGGRFAVGHDAKLKSRLINQVLDESSMDSEKATAEARLQELGWLSHLDAARASRSKRVERAAKKAEAEVAKASQPKARKAQAETKATETNDHLESAIADRKAAKAHQGKYRTTMIDGHEQVVHVDSVKRRDANDVNSPFIAKVTWFDDPEAQTGKHETDVEVSELQAAAAS